MSWHFLQEQEEVSWQEDSLDGAPSVLLRLIPIAEEFSCRDKEMESLNDFQSGMMSKHLMEPDGKDLLMSSQEDFHVKTSHVQELEKDSKERDQVFGLRWPGLSLKFDHHLSLWRIHPCLFQEVLTSSSQTLPKWGMMLRGVLSEHTMLVHHTKETEYGYWLPTPSTSESGYNRSASPNAKLRPSLGYMARHNLWPNQNTVTLNRDVKRTDGGLLNPNWTEWLMGWPIGWTELKPLVMAKFQQWLHLHGIHFKECSTEENNDSTSS